MKSGWRSISTTSKENHAAVHYAAVVRHASKVYHTVTEFDEKVHLITIAVHHTTVLHHLNEKNCLNKIVNHLFYK